MAQSRRLSVRQPKNEKIFRYLERGEAKEDESAPRDGALYYLKAGSHPDVVERIWDQHGNTVCDSSTFRALEIWDSYGYDNRNNLVGR